MGLGCRSTTTRDGPTTGCGRATSTSRHRDAGRGRQGRRQPRAGLPVRAAARRRLVPGKHAGGRQAQVRPASDRPGAADRARLPARAPQRLEASAGPPTLSSRKGRRPTRSAGRTRTGIARDDRGGDRGAGLRGRHRGAAPANDDSDQRRPLRAARQRPTTCADQGPQARQGPSTTSATPGRPAEVVDPLPGARPARRQAPGRPGDRQHAQDGRPQAQRGRLLAPLRFDGYGEQRDGGPWRLSTTTPHGPSAGPGRSSPASAASTSCCAGRPANAFLQAMAGSGNAGGMLPEQVWDGAAPTGKNGFKAGEGTFSATPLAWTHAQFIRLAWSIEAHTPVERRRSW